jgi:hypothetical protein
MSQQQTYSGSCHCGRVRFEVVTELDRAGVCNCSICHRVGWTMISVEPARFRLLAGGDAQTDYQFGRKSMHHLFCSTCGVHSFGRFESDGTEKIVVNVRCLDGVELGALEVQSYDGKSY